MHVSRAVRHSIAEAEHLLTLRLQHSIRYIHQPVTPSQALYRQYRTQIRRYRDTRRSMAPLPQPATVMEFHEPDNAKPQPLRIIKRSQTIAACSSPRAVLGISRSVSGITNSSRGSPPLGPDRPLTVHKRRKGRGSIFGSSLDEGPLEEMSFSEIA